MPFYLKLHFKVTFESRLSHLVPRLILYDKNVDKMFNCLWPSDAMATWIWVNIGPGNGLLPDGTEPLPEPMLTYHQWLPVTFSRHATSPCEHGDLRFFTPLLCVVSVFSIISVFYSFPRKKINLHKTSLKSIFKRVWCQFMAHSQDFRHCSTSSNPKM